MFDKKIAFFHEKLDTKEEALKLMSDVLKKEGFVKDTYYDGLVNREKEFPTGLQTSIYGIAIPHTDAVHVNKPQIAFMSLEDPIEFDSMEGGDPVPVSIVIMLALQESGDQLAMLQQVVSVFQSEETMNSLYKAKDSETVANILLEAGIE